MLGRLSRVGGGSLGPADLAVIGWGSGGGGAPVMPGIGDARPRESYDVDELQALAATAERLEEDVDALMHRLGAPIDVHLNGVAFLKGVPSSVYDQVIGGYQVLKKWLSYRDQEVIGRSITVAEAREAVGIVRRLTGVILMQPALDASYVAIRAQAFGWAGTISPDS